eukprot:1138140-Pelagomonas_calceolata.AAC.2
MGIRKVVRHAPGCPDSPSLILHRHAPSSQGMASPGYGQSHLHPGGLCGECSRHLEVVCTAHYVVAVRLLAGHQASYLH